MTKFIFPILIFFGLTGLFPAFSQQPPVDCGCNAALRYDVYKKSNNFYSEMLLAREINSENYKLLQEKAGGSLSIFGIELGANGEHLEQIKSKYYENLNSKNTVSNISEYQSITTSNASYETFQFCMEKCLKSKRNGFDAYVIAENKDKTTIALHYANEERSAPLEVKYEVGNQVKSVKVKQGTFPTVTIPRIDKKGFTVVFTPVQQEPKSVDIKPYEPITANMRIEYLRTITKDTVLQLSKLTDNNSNIKFNLFDRDAVKRVQDEGNNVPNYINNPDGIYRFFPDIANDGYQGTRLVFSLTAPQGYTFRGYSVSCNDGGNNSASGPCAFKNSRELLKTATRIVRLEQTYSAPVTLTLTAEAYKTVQFGEASYSYTKNNIISFIVPKDATKKIIYWEGVAFSLPFEKPNDFLEVISDNPTEDQNFIVYQLRIKKFLDSKKIK